MTHSKLNSFVFSAKIQIIFFVAFSLSSCRSGDKTGDPLTYTGVAIYPTSLDQRLALQDIKFSYLNGDAAVASWSFADDQNKTLASSCLSTGTPIATCSFQSGGQVHYTLDITDTAGRSHSVSGVIEVLEPASVNYGPEIKLVVTNSGTVINKLGTIRTGNTGNAVYPRLTPIKFDLSGTIAQNTRPDQIQYTIDFGMGPISGGPVFFHTFQNVGVYPLKIYATDASGARRQLGFTATIQCQRAADGSPLEGTLPFIDTAKINIQEDWRRDPTKPKDSPEAYYLNNNYFYFDATTAVSGGGPGNTTYKYYWDFNGDGFLDNDWTLKSASEGPMYVAYSGPRKVSLKVMDLTCNYFSTTTFDHDFRVFYTDAIPGHEQGSQLRPYPHYYHVQGKMSPLAPATPNPYDALQNVDFIASWNTKEMPNRKVTCNYGANGGNAAISIEGLHSYTGTVAVNHGIQLKISGVRDSVPNGSSGTLDTSGVMLDQATYWTDQGSDQTLSRGTYGFVRSSTDHSLDCTLGLIVRKVAGTASCNSDQTGGATSAITIDGTYSCPRLQSTQGDIKIEKGAFYCETGSSDACTGGSTISPKDPPPAR